MNRSSKSVSEQNIQHFKFQSQLFHKFYAAVSEQPEIKGTKALDRYARMQGFRDFNHAHEQITRQTKLIKFFPFPTEQKIVEECANYSDNPEHIKLVSLFYSYYFYTPSNSETAKALFKASLRDLESFTHFPVNPNQDLWQNGDALAVALARRMGATELMEKQLCGLFMMLFDIYEANLIPSFGFQDLIDILHPQKYAESCQLYETKLYDEYRFRSTAPGVYSKIKRYCTREDLQDHRQFYFDAFASISRQPLSLDLEAKETIFDVST